MEANSKRRTIYSPVTGRSPADSAPIETLAKLRYLDDSTTSGEEEFKPGHEAVVFEKCPDSRARTSQSRAMHRHPSARRLDEPASPRAAHKLDGGFAEAHPERPQQDDSLSVEEVYLYTCCGITKPLEPASKHMPFFRSLLVLFSVLVFAFGLATLGMGLWFRIDPKVYEIHKYIETQNFTLAGWIMLAAGFAACLTALLALACVTTSSVCLLIFHSITMTLLIFVSIGSLVLLTVYGLGAPLERFLTKEIYEQIRRRTTNTEIDLSIGSDAAQFLDFVQVKMRCCGALDFRDYPKLGMVIPTTCYTIAGNYVNAPGCGRALRQLFDIRAGLAVGFVTGLVLVLLAATLVSSLMVCSIYNWRATSRPASRATYRRSPIDK